MSYWLVKTDPDTYSWEDFKKEKDTSWDGIRNYAARNHLKAMKKGDKVLVYHSGGESEIKGIAVVSREYYPDPTSKDSAWVSVGLKSGPDFKKGINLKQIKSNPKLKNMVLLKISRLSVMPVTEDEFSTVLNMSSE